MPSVREVRDRIEALTRRMRAKAERIAEVEPKARAAVLQGEGKLNGKVPELVGLRFEHDALADEIRRLEEQELPAAQNASEAAERAKALGLARRINTNRVASAEKIDALLASVDEALATLLATQASYARAMQAAGHGQRTPHWQDLLRRAVWEQSPQVAELLGVSRAVRNHASTMADMLGRLAPPAEPDPLAMPAPAPENKQKAPRGPVLRGAADLVRSIMPARAEDHRLAAKARKKAEERERNARILAALDRGEDVSAMLLPAPGPKPNADNKLVPPRGDDAWQGEELSRPDSMLAGADERRRAKALKREALARGTLDDAMPVRASVHEMPTGSST